MSRLLRTGSGSLLPVSLQRTEESLLALSRAEADATIVEPFDEKRRVCQTILLGLVDTTNLY